MARAIGFEHILNDLIAVAPGEVDIEIGWGGPAGIQEAFEVKVQLNRVHIGNLQAESNDRIGSAAAAYIIEITVAGVLNDVMGDKKVGVEALVIDNP